MHHCLCISELLLLIFQLVGRSDQDECRQDTLVAKKSLAALARTCRLFSSPALDVLWHDLYSFDPLLKLFPSAQLVSIDDTQWLTFNNYAKRVKTIHGREARVPTRVRQEFLSSLQHCPPSLLPLLPNITQLGWSELSFSTLEDSGISLLRYFSSPAVTTVNLSLVRWLAHSSAELAVLADLPRLCPNVTLFSITLGFSWDYEPYREVGRMVMKWPRLRTLRTCALSSPVMDHLFSQRHLESLGIDYHASSPKYAGRIPDSVCDIAFGVDGPSLCTHFLENVYAGPTRFRLLIGMNEEQKETDIEHMFHLLPLHLVTSRLQSLTVQPKSGIIGIPLWHTLKFRPSFVSALVAFRALHELDLDLLCTAHMSDADYARLAASLTHLSTLKLGTANPSIMRPWPAASIGAIIAILTHCRHLQTFHIVFDGSIPPPGCLLKDGRVSGDRRGWGVTNGYVRTLGVGYSPIGNATVDAIAACFRSIMPHLVRIEHKDRDREWSTVQNLLVSD